MSPEIDKIAFALPVGAVSDPITTPQGTAIVRVVEKEGVTDEQMAGGLRPDRAKSCVNQRRDRFFSAYMVKAKEKLEDRHEPGNAGARRGDLAGLAPGAGGGALSRGGSAATGPTQRRNT